MQNQVILIFTLSLLLACSQSQPLPITTPDVCVYSRDDLRETMLMMLRDAGEIEKENNASTLLGTLPDHYLEPFLYLRNEFPRNRLMKEAAMYGRFLEFFDVSPPKIIDLWWPKVENAQISDQQLVIIVRILRSAGSELSDSLRASPNGLE